MQLTRLTVTRGDHVVREVIFKQGLNLILDKPTSVHTESGNNIGKTTVLRLIDYCLGSDGADIWRDSEFKDSINKDVYDFLHGTPSVYVTLETTDGYRGDHKFRRSFVTKGANPPPALYVDDVPYKDVKHYREALKNILFGTQGKKPGLRQLVPKFVRSSTDGMSRTLKFLGSFGSDVDYESVHLFLFGFFNMEILEERATLPDKRASVARDLLGATRLRKEGEIEQLLLHLRREVEEAQKTIEVRGEIPEITTAANEVSELRGRASEMGSTLARLEGEIASIELAIASLKNDYASVDYLAVKSIYSEAGKYVEKLQHDWEDLSGFVASLRGRKERFLEQQLAELLNQAYAVRQALAGLQVREDQFVQALRQTRAFEVALEVRADLQEKLKQLGGLEQNLSTIKTLRTNLEAIDEKLKETQKGVEEGKALLTKRVATFNEFFTELSKKLYGEQYLLTFDESKKGAIVFSLTSVGANVGAGKKASQTAAFDIAYIKFLKASGINFPRFVCHDGIEAIHGNQLAELLSTADSLDGQLVLATIRDKLPPGNDEFIAQNTVLELSQDDKLFKV